MSTSGYAAWRRGGQREKRLSDVQLVALIRAVHVRVRGAYGSPRMWQELKGQGVPVSRARVERLMHEHGIRARHKRRWKATTDSRHTLPVAPGVGMHPAP